MAAQIFDLNYYRKRKLRNELAEEARTIVQYCTVDEIERNLTNLFIDRDLNSFGSDEKILRAVSREIELLKLALEIANGSEMK